MATLKIPTIIHMMTSVVPFFGTATHTQGLSQRLAVGRKRTCGTHAKGSLGPGYAGNMIHDMEDCCVDMIDGPQDQRLRSPRRPNNTYINIYIHKHTSHTYTYTYVYTHNTLQHPFRFDVAPCRGKKSVSPARGSGRQWQRFASSFAACRLGLGVHARALHYTHLILAEKCRRK